MNFKKWIKNIQTAGYNGSHTVLIFFHELINKIFLGDFRASKEKFLSWKEKVTSWVEPRWKRFSSRPGSSQFGSGSSLLNIYEHWTLLKFKGQIKNLPNLNATLIQTFNVKSLKTAMVMESVMVQENANALTIGNQKQIALVIILN